MIAIFFVSSLFASKAFACRQGCINSSTTATTTCACQEAGGCGQCKSNATSSTSTNPNCPCSGQGDCKCKENGKECKCDNCKDKQGKQCDCSGSKDCKCKANGKDCQCGNCKVEPDRIQKDKASEKGVINRIKGWLKGMAFWKRK